MVGYNQAFSASVGGRGGGFSEGAILKDGDIKIGNLQREAKVGMGVHRREHKEECKLEDKGLSHWGIPKEGNIKSDDIKTIRWNPGGGAKVSMGVQRRFLEGA